MHVIPLLEAKMSQRLAGIHSCSEVPEGCPQKTQTAETSSSNVARGTDVTTSCWPLQKTKASPWFPVVGQRSSATPVTSHLRHLGRACQLVASRRLDQRQELIGHE